MKKMNIPDNTKIQSIDLRVNDLEKSFNFYSDLLGFKEIETKDNISFLSANGKEPYLIKLTEDKNSVQRPAHTTGLYHIAIRFPNRKELARVFLRLFNQQYKFQGFSDLLVSEAIYLADPEGNGIELYTDKPRSEWKWHIGEIQMETLPLNLSVLTDELEDREAWNGIHPETDIGHIHLNVSNLFKAEKFYNDILGFNITSSAYPGALFLSAGGYHHHIGVNTWNSNNGKTAPKNSTGLISFTVKIDDIKYLELLKEKAEKEGLLLSANSDSISIMDFDRNKIQLI